MTPNTSLPKILHLHLIMLSVQEFSNLRAIFPFPYLTSITSAPTYQTMQVLQTEINSNAVSVHSLKSTFGRLALTISQLDYLLTACEIGKTVVFNDLYSCPDCLSIRYWIIGLGGNFLTYYKLGEHRFDGCRWLPRRLHSLCVVPQHVIINISVC